MVITYTTPRAINGRFNVPSRIAVHHHDGEAH